MDNYAKELNWINSFGGPLILLDQKGLISWEGSSEKNDTTDYERACLIEDYLGLVEVADSFGLVLGDEPSQTTWQPISQTQGIIIRWVWADNEAQIENSLENIISSDKWEDTNIEIEFQTDSLFLFDSALNCKLNEHLDNSLDNSLEIKLDSGNYSLKNLFYKPDESLNLLVHKLVKNP